MSQRASRRRFIKTTAAISAGYWIADRVAKADSRSPNSRVAFACIGLEGKGHEDSSDAGNHGDVVAVCDIDENTLAKATKRFPKAKQFHDYRKMLEEMAGSIDAVTVTTPDHIHAPAAAMAMHLGKHCFVQKPLTHSLHEARVLAQLAKEKKVATQMGNQGTAQSGLRRAAALLKAGALGDVSEVHIWTNRPIWPQGVDRPAPSAPPASLHWNEWLGPAPERPYGKLGPVPGYPNGHDCYHPFSWRGWWDFGTGALGDIACHAMNMPFRGLDLRDPVAVQAETSGHNKDSFPSWSIITFEFAATEQRPALKVIWYDGGKHPDPELLAGEKVGEGGCLVIGSKGTMHNSKGSEAYRITGTSTLPEVKIVESPGHFTEWVDAVRGGPAAFSNFVEYAGPLTETVLMGNLAVWVAANGKGDRVEWDAKNQRVKNISGLEGLIQREYRKGYSL